jgi:hypothetical protein
VVPHPRDPHNNLATTNQTSRLSSTSEPSRGASRSAKRCGVATRHASTGGTRGFDVFEPCHGYRVTMPVAGRLDAVLTWSPGSWMSLAYERARGSPAGMPTADNGRLRLSLGVKAGETVLVTVGNHGANPSINYTLQLTLLPR